MRRNPSLHITKSDLEKVLLSIQIEPNMLVGNLVNEIFDKSQPYQLVGRYKTIAKTKAKTKKKIAKSQEVDSRLPKGSVERFNRLLIVWRTQNNPYTKVRNITKDDRDYILLKEVALKAYDFAMYFELGVQAGFEQYIQIGLASMRRYRLGAFKSYEKSIYEKFESVRDVDNDDKADKTNHFYQIWRLAMMKYTELETIPNLQTDKTKYIHILYARKQADEPGADYELWIEAQFEGLSFMSVIPQLSQFYGDNAKKRYERHLLNSPAVEEEESLTDRYN